MLFPHPTTFYPPRIAALIEQASLAPLGPGSPVLAMRPQLAVSTETLFAPLAIVDTKMANACHAGLWLAYHFLDESHAISQDLETPEGSYWHGILHRREPDYANSKYWFRRVGEHPIFTPLAQEASARWDPFHFIDECEKQCGTGSEQETRLRHVQQREWELLFDWCFRRGIGKG